MNAKRIDQRWSLLLASLGILTIVGCQGGLTRIPSLNGFNNPTRVPPPPTGSFQVPPAYTDPSGGGSTATGPRPTTLGQLRSIETGKPIGDKIELDGSVASEFNNDAFAFTSKPVASQANVNPVRTASSSFDAAANGPTFVPAIVPASAMQELPDPRLNQAANGSSSSNGESVQWKSSQVR